MLQTLTAMAYFSSTSQQLLSVQHAPHIVLPQQSLTRAPRPYTLKPDTHQAALGLHRLPQRQPLRAHAEGVVCFLLPGTGRQRLRERLLRAGAGAGAVVQKTRGGVVCRPLLAAGLRGAGRGRCRVGTAVKLLLLLGCLVVGPQRAGSGRSALACTEGGPHCWMSVQQLGG